jgi:hypothetical protein
MNAGGCHNSLPQFFGGKLHFGGIRFAGSDEAVAASYNSLQELRVFGIVFEGDANLADGRVDSLFHVDEDVFSPKHFRNLLAGDELSLVFDKVKQQLERQTLHAHGLSASRQLEASEIQFKVAESHLLICHAHCLLWRIVLFLSSSVKDCNHVSSGKLMQIQTGSMDVCSRPAHDAVVAGGEVMRYAKWISVILLILVPAIAAAQLGPTDRVVAQVPYTFVAANTVIPLGETTIQMSNLNSTVLLIRNAAAKIDLYVPVSVTNGKEAAGAFALVFHKYGHRYFLAGLKLEGSPEAYSFRPSHFEEELLAQNVPMMQEVLLASLK